MSLVRAPYYFRRSIGFAAELTPCSNVEVSGDQMIPPNDDALMIRFMLHKQTRHTLAGDSVRLEQECWIRPETPTKAITVRPSEFCHHDATSIAQTASGRMMMDYINTHFSPETKHILLDEIVATIIDLVQSSIGSETKAFVDVRRSNTLEIMHYLGDDETSTLCMEGFFGATQRGTCAICLDDYEVERDDGVRLPCLHVFHGHCIYKWLVINPSCPVCCHTFPQVTAPWFNPPLQDNIWRSLSRI